MIWGVGSAPVALPGGYEGCQEPARPCRVSPPHRGWMQRRQRWAGLHTTRACSRHLVRWRRPTPASSELPLPLSVPIGLPPLPLQRFYLCSMCACLALCVPYAACHAYGGRKRAPGLPELLTGDGDCEQPRVGAGSWAPFPSSCLSVFCRGS